MDSTPLMEDGAIASCCSDRSREKLVATLLAMAVLGGGIVFLVVVAVITATSTPPGQVETSCGPVQGVKDTGTDGYSFKGIPFAAPPVGALRWKQPVPLRKSPGGSTESCDASGYKDDCQGDPAGTCWSGVLQADTFGNQCPQVDVYTHNIKGHEDCLYLDIFTPDLAPSKPLPVLVYIHGGYLLFFNGSVKGYSPDINLAHELNAVFVSIQYRLGGLGFLVLDELGPDQTGNYGLWDQIEALKWVQANIRNFGGDPNQVTIFGQSSGGTSVWTLMLAPPAKGLFHRVWTASGSPLLNSTLQEAAEANRFFLNNTGCSTKECLMNLTADEVVAGVHPKFSFAIPDSGDFPTKGDFVYALIVIDGHLFPKAPLEMIKSPDGSYSDVPFMVGTMAQEVDFGPAPGEALKTWTHEDFVNYTRTRLDTFGDGFADRSLAVYEDVMSAENDAEYNFTTIVSDLRVNCGNDIVATRVAEAFSSPVYRYVGVQPASTPADAFHFGFLNKYAFHSWDMFAFFDSMAVFMPHEPEVADYEFRDTVRRNIMSFVRGGEPADAAWKPFPEVTALLAANITYTPQHNKRQCDYWDKNHFYSYSWIN